MGVGEGPLAVFQCLKTGRVLGMRLQNRPDKNSGVEKGHRV